MQPRNSRRASIVDDLNAVVTSHASTHDRGIQTDKAFLSIPLVSEGKSAHPKRCRCRCRCRCPVASATAHLESGSAGPDKQARKEEGQRLRKRPLVALQPDLRSKLSKAALRRAASPLSAPVLASR
jgi:hypothetical protein